MAAVALPSNTLRGSTGPAGYVRGLVGVCEELGFPSSTLLWIVFIFMLGSVSKGR